MGILELFRNSDDDNLQAKMDAIRAQPGESSYEVGDRPLNSAKGKAAYWLNKDFAHHQFLRDDSKNIGWSGDGDFIEPLTELPKYTRNTKYGTNKFSAKLIDDAIKEKTEYNNMIREKARDLGVEDEAWLLPDEYSLPMNNCQQYVNDVINRAYNIKINNRS